MPALSLLAFRSLASNRIRTAIVVAAVLLSMAAFNAVLLANEAMTRGLEMAVQSTVGRAQLQVRSASTLGFPDATVDRIKALPAVRKAQRMGVAGAGRRQRFEAETLQITRGADIPWVGNDEATRFVQLAERLALFGSRRTRMAHSMSPDFQV